MLLMRAEEPGDVAAIREVHRAAFAAAPHGGRVEAAIVDRLRAAGALTVSLVAIDADRPVPAAVRQTPAIVGHVAFSPVRIDGAEGDWYGLGPVGVVPSAQRRGVGSMLITRGLSVLETGGAGGVVLVGEPSYYVRFGFACEPSLTYAGVPPEYFLVRRFSDLGARGAVTYHPAFDVGPDATT